MNAAADSCTENDQAEPRATFLRRATRMTIRKKLALLFGLLLLIGAGNALIIQSSISRLQGMATLINITGSLRWISQSILLDTHRLLQGLETDRTALENRLKRLDETLGVLDAGGIAFGHEVRSLPPHLQDALDSIWKRSINYRQRIEGILNAETPPRHVQPELNYLYRDSQIILESADIIAATLATNVEQIEAQAMRDLVRLVILDLAVLAFGLLVIRYQVVLPLRLLSRASRRIASGRHDARVGFRSQDEIGEVAQAFDQMADTIQRDMAQIAQDMKELKETEYALRKMSRAIESSPVTVMITNAQGTIEYVNPKFTEITGFAPQEALGRTPGLLKSGRTPASTYHDLWTTIRSGLPWRGVLLNRKKSGEMFWEDTRIISLKDEQGRITHYIAVKEDITERKAAQDKVVQLNADLERRVAERTSRLTSVNRELESFSYSISHDLRAPLRGINGFAHLMEEHCQGCSKIGSLDYLERIKKASIRMGDLIDDLLDLSRVSRSEVRLEPVRLSEMAHSILTELIGADPDRRMRIHVQENLTVRGDPTLLHAAMQNLLGNAWKFSSKRVDPLIEFACTVVAGEQVFHVKDNGAGFDMRFADKLFAPFQRLHRAEEFEGTGIGLATVQRIIAMHGGRIWAESTIGEGATFRFVLPERPQDAPPG